MLAHILPRLILSLICSVPLSVISTWFVIDLFKLKEEFWPKIVVLGTILFSVANYLVNDLNY